MDRSRESHWQAAWSDARLAEGKRVDGREKFYAIVAYPGPSGFLHLGHLRGLLLADALHRYHRMQGRSVFFPTGTHASGLPAVTFARRVKERDALIVQQLRDNGVPESRWAELEVPEGAARFLGASYVRLYAQLGILIDERAYLTTIDEDYRAFIRWQFRRLERAGALTQGVHYSAFCPVCGPVSVDPSETDLSSGGEAETVVYTLLPFRLDDGRILLAATLRPETVFGVTNVWLAPEGELVVWHHDRGEFLVGHSGGERLVEQHGGRLGARIQNASLFAKRVRAPLTDRPVPVLPSPLVDPSIGTGVVMSVPAHAPSDWVAVSQLDPGARGLLGEIPDIIALPPVGELAPSERTLMQGEGPPAARASAACHARSLDDAEALHQATERLYRLEHLRGRMRGEPLAGMPVPEARAKVETDLRALPGGGELREFSLPVVCRNGHAVGIRRIPDQWFLRYSDSDWKEETKAWIAGMSVRPEEYARELPSIIDWFQDRPATRQGSWLGTPFPLDREWVIEPIADSTFYPAYFVVRRFVTAGRLHPEDLSDAFFDRVFLGEGPGEPAVDVGLQEEVRSEFLYWYPLDLNIGGKEHKRVHFPVFLFTHCRLLPAELRPRGLFVHWWLTRTGGGKISKKEVSSKGGAIPPIGEALSRWGADALRLYFYQSASPQQDIEWQPEQVDHAEARLADAERLARESGGPGSGATRELEAWLLAAAHSAIRRVHAAIEVGEIREAVEVTYGAIPALLRRYRLRGGDWGDATAHFRDAWIRLMAPFTPHLAEELHAVSGSGLVAVARFPSAEEFPPSEAALRAEEYLQRLEEDLREVTRLARARGERADGVALFVAAPWKQEVEAWLRAWVQEGAKGNAIATVMARAREHPEVSRRLPEVPRYVQRFSPGAGDAGGRSSEPFDELAILRSAEGYLARRFEFAMVRILPEEQGGPDDPMNRRERARPGQPAFYLFGVHLGRPSGTTDGAAEGS